MLQNINYIQYMILYQNQNNFCNCTVYIDISRQNTQKKKNTTYCFWL